MEARRCRRRIIDRFNQRFDDGTGPRKGGQTKGPSVLERDLQIRMMRKQKIQQKIQDLDKNGDNSKKKKSVPCLVHAGHVYENAAQFRKGISITKFPTTHGLPGTQTKFMKGATPSRYLSGFGDQ